MTMSAAAIASAHRAFGSSDEVLHRRRALYSATIEAATVDTDALRITDLDVLDSPMVRGHLGEVLAGRERFSPTSLVPLSTMAMIVSRADGPAPSIAAGPTVSTLLDPSLKRVASQVGSKLGAVVQPDSEGFDAALERYVGGLSLLRRLSPELAGDLLPHTALVAIVPADPRLGSASFRELPGLVVIPEPQSQFEVTEALVHEGAHQRFFDLGITSSLLRATAFSGPKFRASWSPSTSAEWPIEQGLAAFHAYRCLAALEIARTEFGILAHEHSLLPRAQERAAEIGRWLHRHADHLGEDGVRLLGLMTDHEARSRTAHAPVTATETPAAIRDCGDRKILAFAEDPIRLVWQAASTSTSS